MKKFASFLLTLILLSHPLTVLAEPSEPEINYQSENKTKIVQLKSTAAFKLQTLRQEANPTKLIFVFESEQTWHTKDLQINQEIVSKIDLKALSNRQYSLEIELNGTTAPEFELKNSVGNFQVIFSKEQEKEEQLIVANKTAEELPITETLATPEVIKNGPIIHEDIVESVAIPVVDKTLPSSNTEPVSVVAAKEPQPKPIITKENVLTRIEFINLSADENYLLLGFSPKPNFSYTLNESGDYELLIPEFKLAGTHLAQSFYAPQKNSGFLSVKTAEIKTADQTKLLIRIKAEEFFKLSFLPIPEGIKVTASVSTTN